MERLPLLVQVVNLLSLLLDLGRDLSERVEGICDIVGVVFHHEDVCRLGLALGNDGGVIILLFDLLFLGGSRLSGSSRSVINIRGRTSFGMFTFLRSGLDGILVIILWWFFIMVALALVDSVDPFLEVLALKP